MKIVLCLVLTLLSVDWSCGEDTTLKPTSPICEENVKECGEMAAGDDCLNTETIYPNGEGCQPTCTICIDSTKIAKPTDCGTINCDYFSPSVISRMCSLSSVNTFRPNGPDCDPVCICPYDDTDSYYYDWEWDWDKK